jgi:hypothetical protein
VIFTTTFKGSTYLASISNLNPPANLPVFTLQPQSQTVDEYGTATFTAAATNTTSYQWSKNAANSGTNSTSYAFATTAADNGAIVTVTATGVGGSTISNNATLSVVSYAFKLDGISQYFSMNTTVNLAVGDKTLFKFKAAASNGATRVLFCNAANTDLYKVYLLGGTTLQGVNGYHTAKLDGVSVSNNYTMPTDGAIHEMEFTHLNNGDIKIIGATPVPSAFSNQSFFDLRFVRAAGNITIPLNNKSQGASQTAAVGTRTANIINYNSAGWLVK